MTAAAPAPLSSDPIGALERGNWRLALNLLRDSPERATGLQPRLAAELRSIGRSMAHRAVGDHVRAEYILSDTAQSLSRPGSVLRLLNHTGLPRLALPPDPGLTIKPPLYQTALLVWREQGEIARLRSPGQHRSEMSEDQMTLVLAMVEHLCWVQFDPGTWQGRTPDAEALAIERRIHEAITSQRDGLLASATDIRRLRVARSGAMSKTVWDHVGRYIGLRRLAMAELARRPRPPWTAAKAPDGMPARTGALLAWMAAQERAAA